MSNNTLSRAELDTTGTIKNIHYGDVLIKFGDTLNIQNDDIPYIKDNSKIRNPKYLANGDVIIADTAEDETVGKSTEIYGIIDEKVVSGLHTIPVRPLQKFASKYLGYYINSPAYHNQLLAIMQGIKVYSISKSNIANTIIKFPNIQTQSKIAELLCVLDRRIEKQHRLIDGIKSYKRGALQSIKVPTKTYCVGRIFNITRGYVLPTSNVSEQKSISNCYPVYSSQTKNDGLMGYFNQYLYENAITWTTDGANAGYTRYREGKFYCTNVCGVLLNNDGYANEFVAEKINEISKKYVSYVGNPKLMNNVMAEIKIDLPTIEKQQHYSKLIALFNKLIDYNSKTLENLADIKKSLLQQLFI